MMQKNWMKFFHKKDPMSEDERKFVDLGQVIYRAVWRKKDVK